MQTIISILLLIYAVLYVGASVIFFASISGFRKRLKIAYIAILIGVIIEAIVHIGEALAQLMQWWNLNQFQSIEKTGYLLGPIFIYFGVRAFGRLLQLKGRSTSLWLTLFVGLALAISVSYIGGGTKGPNYVLGPTIFFIWLLFVSTWILIQIWRQTGQIYKQPAYWMAWAIGTLAVAIGQYIVRQFSQADALTLAMIALLVISGLAFCRAGLAFYAIRGQKLAEFKAGELSNSVDIVIYVASLSSNPRLIDPLLDQLRAITASKIEKEFSPSDQQKLLELYLKLEEYITQIDPIRVYSRTLLREFISLKLSQTKSLSKTFWLSLMDLHPETHHPQ